MIKRCAQKERYATRAQANGALAHLKWKFHHEDMATLNAYHCPWCGFFHLGRRAPPITLEDNGEK